MQKTRAKFYCAAVNPGGQPDAPEVNVTFRAVTCDTPENKTWSKYTPSGLLELHITNPDLIERFVQGEEYYLDITAVADEEAEKVKVEHQQDPNGGS